MRLLLDSHSLLWWLLDDDRLPASVAALIDDPRVPVSVGVPSLWELMIKAMAGRLRLPDPPATYFEDRLAGAGFSVIDVERRHVMALPELPQIHGDPFDRMLVAQAIVDDLEIVTGDEVIRSYPVRTIW